MRFEGARKQTKTRKESVRLAVEQHFVLRRRHSWNDPDRSCSVTKSLDRKVKNPTRTSDAWGTHRPSRKPLRATRPLIVRPRFSAMQPIAVRSGLLKLPMFAERQHPHLLGRLECQPLVLDREVRGHVAPRRTVDIEQEVAANRLASRRSLCCASFRFTSRSCFPGREIIHLFEHRGS
jgi:hypothetical protein